MDVNEDEWDGKPCVRLWGLDRKGGRILVLATQIMPYFYLLPDNDENIGSIRKQLLQDQKRFPQVLSITVESRRLPGHGRKALKMVCSESGILSRRRYLPRLVEAPHPQAGS